MMEKQMELFVKYLGILYTYYFIREYRVMGNFYYIKSVVFWCRVCQFICGLCLIKLGLCMVVEKVIFTFLKMVQGVIYMGLCVWFFFIVVNFGIIFFMFL